MLNQITKEQAVKEFMAGAVIKSVRKGTDYFRTYDLGWITEAGLDWMIEELKGLDGRKYAFYMLPATEAEITDVSDLVMDGVIDAPTEVTSTEIPTGPKIRKVVGTEYQLDHYVKCKSASGNFSLDNGDLTALQLRGQPLDEVYRIAAELTNRPEPELRNRYSRLNVGMQRMNLGNLIRRA